MVDEVFIRKSLENAIIKCKPKFESMHTPKQIARFFNLDYEGIVNADDVDDEEDIHYLGGDFHYFKDKNK